MFGEVIQTDEAPVEKIITDTEFGYKHDIITDPEDGDTRAVAISGSPDPLEHGKWVTLPFTTGIGYVLEKMADDSLLRLYGIEGTTFMMEDKVNFATKKQYKTINITEETNGIFAVQGLQYNSGKFGHIENNLSLPAPSSPVIYTQAPLDAPDDIRIEVLDSFATIPMGLKATWSAVVGASSYKLQFFNGNALLSTFEIPAEETEHVFEYRSEKIVEGGTYYARVHSLTR